LCSAVFLNVFVFILPIKKLMKWSALLRSLIVQQIRSPSALPT
jgi:hypothetical protein